MEEWVTTGDGKFAHSSISGLFAEACKHNKYIVYQTTTNFYRRLWCKWVTTEEFANYGL